VAAAVPDIEPMTVYIAPAEEQIPLTSRSSS